MAQLRLCSLPCSEAAPEARLLGSAHSNTAGFSPFRVLGTFSTPGIQLIIEIFHPDKEKNTLQIVEQKTEKVIPLFLGILSKHTNWMTKLAYTTKGLLGLSRSLLQLQQFIWKWLHQNYYLNIHGEFFMACQEKNMPSIQLLHQNVNDKCNTG